MKKKSLLALLIVFAAILFGACGTKNKVEPVLPVHTEKPKDIISAYVNGTYFETDFDAIWDHDEDDIEALKQLFEGRLNEYSEVHGHWLSLYDEHGTKVRPVRIGKDPLKFFSELPQVYFDNMGKLISVISYDIDEGYFHYVFDYDSEGRIIYSEERWIYVGTTMDVSLYRSSTLDIYWNYNDDGSYVMTVGTWPNDIDEDGFKPYWAAYYDENGEELKIVHYDRETGDIIDD